MTNSHLESPNIFVNVYDETDSDWLGLVDIELPEEATEAEQKIIETSSRILVRCLHKVAARAAQHEIEQEALTAAKLGRLLSLTFTNEADIDMSFTILDELEKVGYKAIDRGEGKFTLQRIVIQEPYIDIKASVDSMTTLDE